MLTIKNIRPGILFIPDAGLKLNPGQTVEIEKGTGQIESALKRGYLAAIENGKTGGEMPLQESNAFDLSKLSAVEAITQVNAEADPRTLKDYMETEKRRTVIDALKSRLEDLQGAGQ